MVSYIVSLEKSREIEELMLKTPEGKRYARDLNVRFRDGFEKSSEIARIIVDEEWRKSAERFLK